MPTLRRRFRFTAEFWLMLLVSAAFALKLVIAFRTTGTSDAITWSGFLRRLHTYDALGLYHRVDIFNHPPFMIHVLRIMGLLAMSTRLSFYFWLRLPAIVADVVSAVLLWRLLPGQFSTSLSPRALLLLAVAPTSILISGFHGNTDPVMICFVLLTVSLLDRDKSIWLAGLAFGMSMNIKVLPVIFLPTLLLPLPNSRKRLAFCCAAGATFAAGGLPFILQDPLFIMARLFGYSSNFGEWGLPRLLELGSGSRLLDVLNVGFQAVGKYMVLTIILVEAVWMSRLRHKPTVFTQCGLVALTFMTLTPGFGMQYLAWLVPWVAAEFWMAAMYYLTSGVFLFLTYASWMHVFPRFVPDSIGSIDSVVAIGLLCWASVGILLIYQLRALMIGRQTELHISARQLLKTGLDTLAADVT